MPDRLPDRMPSPENSLKRTEDYTKEMRQRIAYLEEELRPLRAHEIAKEIYDVCAANLPGHWRFESEGALGVLEMDDLRNRRSYFITVEVKQS